LGYGRGSPDQPVANRAQDTACQVASAMGHGEKNDAIDAGLMPIKEIS
jgi:hypothetical protein